MALRPCCGFARERRKSAAQHFVLDMFKWLPIPASTASIKISLEVDRSASMSTTGAGGIVFVRAASVAVFLFATCAHLHGQDARRSEPGRFDFYVLSLSWSPSFCAASAERQGGARVSSLQCGERPFAFVVHGLWPQYERGFPEYCQVPAPRLYRGIVAAMLDLMPAPHLIFNEWDRHGTCSGLSADAYFETVRNARAAVKIPPEYVNLQTTLTVAPADVEDAFIKANPGLSQDGMAIDCDKKRLREVRLCLSKDLKFRDCPKIARRSCRRHELIMPPSR
jgi:ribonuclease T2